MLDTAYLADLVAKHPAAASARVREFSIGDRDFQFNTRAALMGVVNLSPDSWYRESVCLSTEAALRRGRILAAQGAAIVDVGAESTLAQADRANADLQNSRLLPVIRGLAETGILVSVETYEPQVAAACLAAGARVLNLTGADASDDLLRMIADHEAAVILCHVQGRNVREVRDFDLSGDAIPRMHDSFAARIDRATRLGVERIFIDPGMGFYYRNLQDGAARVRHQMQIFLHTFRLRTLGWPICHALPHAFDFFTDQVRCAEPFFAVLAALGRTSLYRTHEVPRVRAVLETLEAFRPAG